ncbi:hypothetical protein BDR05DRAFT_996726 [Suillus weaverae]|nr:hypothetical protein BDR05DRAFT_996726 [Suillus weaverae]
MAFNDLPSGHDCTYSHAHHSILHPSQPSSLSGSMSVLASPPHGIYFINHRFTHRTPHPHRIIYYSINILALVFGGNYILNFQWGEPDDNMWGQSDSKSQGALGWDVSALGWGQASGEQPISNIPEAHTDSSFPIPQPHSGQKRGEDWKKFFARRHEENKKKEETETPA